MRGTPMNLPALCAHHRSVYTTRARALKRRVHHPGHGWKALRAEAATVARQCPQCISEAA